MKQLFIMLLLSAAMLIGGCSLFAAVERNDLAVRIAVAEFIDGDSFVAARVAGFAEDALEKLEGDPMVNLANLRTEAYTLIPWHKLSGGQRVLAGGLLQAIEDKIRRQLSDNDQMLNKEVLSRLRVILQRIKDTAEKEMALALAMTSKGAPHAKPVMMDTVQVDVGFGDSLTPEVGVGKPAMAITDVGFGEGIEPDMGSYYAQVQPDHARPSDSRV